MPARKLSPSLLHKLKVDAHAAWLAARDPRAPWYARILGLLVTAYALSPLDLIPDFIPVLGYLDDAILLPGLIWLAVRLLPEHVIQECRTRAEEWMANQKTKPASYAGALAIVAIWLGLLALGGWWYGSGD